MKRILFTHLFLLMLWSASGQTSQIRFNRLTTNEGLSNPNVLRIAEDSYGYMWFATAVGVNKYDGNKIVTYISNPKDPNTLINNYAYCIKEDRKGNLWVGTTQGLHKYNRELDRFEPVFFTNNGKDRTDMLIWDVYEDSKNNFWVCTPGNLKLLDRRTMTFSSQLQNINGDAIREATSITEDKNGILWVAFKGDLNGGVARWDRANNKVEFYNKASGKYRLPENSATAVFCDSQGKIWIGHETKGLSIIDDENKTIETYNTEIQGRSTINNNAVQCFAQYKNNLILIATDKGISFYDIEKKEFRGLSHSETNEEIAESTVQHIAVSRSGDIWLASRTRGVNFYSPYWYKFDLYTHNTKDINSLSSNSVSCFAEDKNNNIWITTDGGALNRFTPDDKTFEAFAYDEKNKNSPTSNKTLALIIDDKNRLWSGMWQGGIDRFLIENNQPIIDKRFPLVNKDMSHSHSVFRLYQSADGSIWSGNFKSGVFRYDSEADKFDAIELPDTTGAPQLFSMITDFEYTKDSVLWIATTGTGIYSYDQKTNDIKLYYNKKSDPASIPTNFFNSLHIDSKDRLWLGSQENGIIYFDRKKGVFQSFGTEQSLPSNSISGIKDDKHGNLWITSANGLTKMKITEQKSGLSVSCTNFDLADGLQDKSFNAWADFEDSRGYFYFGGVGGFNVFHPDSIKLNPHEPPVYFTDLKLFNKSVIPGAADSILKSHIGMANEIKLNYDQNMITISYVALNYVHSEKNTYEYKMEGFDKDWNQVGHKQEATYTNLDPGTYTFMVRAANNDGIWNKTGNKLVIHISPPWWNTLWFKIVAIIGTLTIILLIFRMRIRAVQKQRDMLETQVQERTYELSEANAKLEEHKEELIQQSEELEQQATKLLAANNHMKSSIQYAQTVQMAMLPSVKKFEAQNNAFVLFIPKDIVSGDFYWFADIPEINARMIAVVDCTGHGVPGALMSMIGSRMLAAIVNEQKIYEPDQILARLNQMLIDALRQKETGNDDGMDVCLVRTEKTTDGNIKLKYAGAKRPLIYVANHQLETIKGSISTIGGALSQIQAVEYSIEERTLPKGSLLYLTTDGYTDQASEDRKSFSTKGLRNLIGEIADKPLSIQKQILLDELQKHQQTAPQRDDITIVGIRL